MGKCVSTALKRRQRSRITTRQAGDSASLGHPIAGGYASARGFFAGCGGTDWYPEDLLTKRTAHDVLVALCVQERPVVLGTTVTSAGVVKRIIHQK